MSVNVGSAYMTILPDLKGFGPRVRSQVDGEIGGSSPTSRALAKHGAAGGKAYGEGFRHSLKGLAEGIGALFVFDKAKDFLKESLGEAEQAKKINALTATVIRSTGGAAHVSAVHVDELAASIQKKSAVDSEQVKSSENLLLTFTNVRNEVGRGNRIFDRATRSAIDLGAGLAAASHGQINFRQATTLVGKALNDPVKGLTALRRVGVAFSVTQQKQIKDLVASNHTMAAQKLILRELNREFGGAAKSQATPAERSKLAWKDLRIEIGSKLLPEVEKLQIFTTTKLIPTILNFVHGMENGTGAGGAFAGDLRNIYNVGKDVVGVFERLPGPVKKYGIELAIAVLVVRKFGPALASARLSMASFATGMGNAQTRSAQLRSGLATLAGAGGLLLLFSTLAKTNGSVAELDRNTSQTSDRLRFLKGTVGGAALGFSAFGPAGAVIGGVAGSLFAVTQNSRAANAAADAGTPKIAAYAETFRRLSGAATDATKNTIRYNLSQTQGIEAARLLGVSENTLVGAIMGHKGALDLVNKAIAEGRVLSANGTNQYTKAGTDAATALSAVLFGRHDGGKGNRSGLSADYKAATVEAKKQAAVIVATKAIVDKFPRRIATRFEAGNIPKTDAAVAALAKRYDLTRRQVRTLVTALGIPRAKGDIQLIIDKAHELGRQAPVVTPRVDSGPFLATIAQLLHPRTIDVTPHQVGGLGALLNPTKPTKPPHKAMGGRVSAGTLYQVNEAGLEYFAPDMNGTILSHRQTKAAMRGTMPPPPANLSLAGQRLSLLVDGREFHGYVDARADSRVNSAAALAGEMDRAL